MSEMVSVEPPWSETSINKSRLFICFVSDVGLGFLSVYTCGYI